ncbi:hypothetical protein [uncultured Paludibaculum sp.]|uniref:hypothetical protein n=1 Tax=uncultured Paludibaculum sp. TaxID=1765020 RepID=UPI002AAB709F|nr:hypothetical protein [uncultured Paludibaculum sp.]
MLKPVTARYALALLLFATSGCSWFGRKPKAPPTPPAPVPVVAPKPDPPPAQQQPQPQPEPPPAQQQPEPPPQQQPVPVQLPPSKPKPAPAPTPPPAPKPAPPAFGQILSPQQQTELRNSYQQSAKLARQVLNLVKGKALSRDQAESANRIRSFLLQADEAQAKDPAAAAQLAHRAEVLARDLQSSIR